MKSENLSTIDIAFLKNGILDVLRDYYQSSKSLRKILRKYRDVSSFDTKTFATLEFLTIGAVRFQNTIDFILSRCTKGPNLKSLSLRNQSLLRVCLYWIRWQGKTVDSIDGLLLEEDSRILDILIRAKDFDLSSAITKLPRIESLSVQLSFPTFIVETLLANMDERDAVNLMLGSDSDNFSYLRINQLLSKDTSMIKELESTGVSLEEDSEIPGVYRVYSGLQNVIGSPIFSSWKILVHDKASVVTARTLAPSPGDFVWDACAAPGMKTQVLWELMESRGTLVATERNKHRFEVAMAQSSEMGMSDVVWKLGDASHCPVNGANKILIDAPCTSTGMIHSHPSFKWRLNKKTLLSIMTIQNKILEGILSAYSNSPGTEIVYATCSILPHEGESQIDSVLEKFPIELIEIPLVETEGYPNFKCSSMVRRMFPHIHSTDGFFIAKMRIMQ